MRFGDEELGGKHVDPANIRMQGEQQECAKLIGYGRKMLGNLKHRMQLGDLEMGKTSQSGTYKYMARLEDLERWGRPVVGKRSILNLHDRPESLADTEYEVSVNWSVTANSVKSATEGGDLDGLNIKTEVGYNLADTYPIEEQGFFTEEPRKKRASRLPVRRIIGYIVQGFIEFEDPLRKNHVFTVTTPSGITFKNDYENLYALEPDMPYDGFPYFGTKKWPVQRWVSYSDDTGDVYEDPSMEYLLVRDLPGTSSYTFGGPQLFYALPDYPDPPILGTLVPDFTIAAMWQATYTNREAQTVYLGSQGVTTQHYQDVYGPGLMLPWYNPHGINDQYVILANTAAVAEMEYMSGYLQSLPTSYHSYQYYFYNANTGHENTRPMVQHTSGKGFITGSGFTKSKFLHFEFTERNEGNGEAAVFMIPSTGKPQFSLAASADEAGASLRADYTVNTQIATSSGATWDNAPTPNFGREIRDNAFHYTTRDYFISEPFGIPMQVEPGFHTITQTGGSGDYKVYLLVETELSGANEYDEILADTTMLLEEVWYRGVTPQTTIKIYVGDLPPETPYIIQRTDTGG